MNILIIEPYFSGSHAQWLNNYCDLSSHNIKILSMKGRFWKWRMYGAAVTMAKQFRELQFKPDVLLVTDMLDLTTFLSLVRRELDSSIPIKVYFHENQLAYPWEPKGEDKSNKRDVHYGFINYHTALAADTIFFNSRFNMESFYGAIKKILAKMPDYKHSDEVEKLRRKSEVLHIGMNIEKMDSVHSTLAEDSPPLILWNHRWEFDKNPQDFFKALFILKQKGKKFKLALLGESYQSTPSIFKEAIELLSEEIVVTGYKTGDEYFKWLKASQILPVTSNHDFFGISVMEAVYAGVLPILPNRLTYPDLFSINDNPQLFYNDFDEFVEKLSLAIDNKLECNREVIKKIPLNYDWKNMIPIYDKKIGELNIKP
jgi:glycosyltransferase involved in cell wall biosynthesis